MSWIVMLSMSAWGNVEGDIARGWYLWRTGRDDAAVTTARESLAGNPDAFGAHELMIAMEVAQGNGASVEAHYRDAWGQDTEDPLGRVNLAMVLALRNAGEGAWCSEVAGLLKPVIEGEAHYWATRAERLQEQRCKGSTDHADAELRRIAKEGGIGWADGVIAKVAAGYLKPEMSDEVETLWTEHPHRLHEAHLVWGESVAGPARGKIRSITSRALKAAVEGDDASLVHAAMLAYARSGRVKKADEARLRLAQLDPGAELDLDREVAAIADPAIYAEVDACNQEAGPFRVLDCLTEVEGVPPTGAIAAYHASKLRLAYAGAQKPEQALEASLAAWKADPRHRYNARMVALDVNQLGETATAEQRDIAVAAVDVAIGDRIPESSDDVIGARRRRMLASDLDLWCEVYRAAGRAEEALPVQLDALLLQDTPRRRLRLGGILADAGRVDDAVLQLVHGIHYEEIDTQAISEGRELLLEVAGSWNPRGLSGMMREVSGAPGQRPKRHALVNRALPDLPGLAAPESVAAEGEEPADVRARVLMTWAPFAPESNAAMKRLQGMAETYAPKGVQFQTVDVGLSPAELDESHTLPNAFGGAAVMRAFRAVAPPTVVVVDARGRVRGVLASWLWKKIDLEALLDELVE